MEKKIRKVKDDKFTSHLYFEFKEVLKKLSKEIDAKDDAPVIAITSSGEKEGKTFVTLALALQISKYVNKKILIVDAGRQHVNSASYLLNINKIDNDSYIQSTDESAIDIIPDILEIEDNDSDILHTDDFRNKLNEYKKHYSLILIDGRAMDDTVNAIELFRISDAVLYVIEYGKFTSFKINSYIERMKSLNLRILGAVLNKRQFPIPEFVYKII